ncbi:MAG TPA: formyl transferase [Casimicrobiaceae bacterium]|nr:formyl transferase [Casimicrobiaceae bacterium]
MSSLSVMILCGRSPRHLYVANRLCEGGRALAIVQETGTPWSVAKAKRVLRPAHLWRKAWRWLRDRRRYRGEGEARFFFGATPPRLTREDLAVNVPSVDHRDVVAMADRLRPDVIAVFGTSLIRGPLLTRGRLGIFNLHGGLSPHYRGADCTFWALYNGEPAQVGCTLHRIDAGIDTGTLIAHVSPEVTERDDELTLFWRGVRDSAEAYVEMLDRLERGEALGQRQPERGRLYQVRQRGWREERELARRMRNGLLKGLALPPRVRWYPAPAADIAGQQPRADLTESQAR